MKKKTTSYDTLHTISPIHTTVCNKSLLLLLELCNLVKQI